jgi:outer membrane protein assembly factor BamE (lipoprotein component of BamABCDE complex)
MNRLRIVALACLAACFAVPSWAQQGFGSLDSTPPAGMTADQIIQKMGSRESEFAAARNLYTFRQDVKFNTISDDTNRPDGEYHQVTDITFDKDGRRMEHVVFAPANTIERVIMTENDFKDIEKRLPFILTAPELPDYDIKYAGRQKVDELDTYAFDVAPKRFDKGKRYFQGRVWVDQQDDEIVMVNGMSVPQDTRPGHADLSPPFTTYYEQIDGKYWFPTYTRAEGTLHFPPQNGAMSEDIKVRSIVKYTDYKQFHTNVKILYNGEDITNQKDDSSPQTTPAPKDKK